MSDALLQQIRQRGPLTKSEAEAIREAWGPSREAAPGETLLQPGQVCRSVWFLDAGFARFYAEPGDADVTRHFAGPGTLFTVVASLYTGAPSREGLQVLTAARLRTISREAHDRLAAAIPTYDAFRRAYVREVYDYLDRALDQARQFTAAERYAAFIREQPEVVLNVPLRHVASYLGMTPQSLSRVRAAA